MTLKPDLEAIEIDLFLDGVNRHYGYDFRGYSRASMVRRLKKFISDEGLKSVSDLQGQALRDNMSMSRLIAAMSVSVTSMFRDPEFFKAFRKFVAPRLQTYPYLRLWVAGCSTGEEAYSLAILLKEEGLLERSRIYATDFSDKNVQQAKQGAFPLNSMQAYTTSYIAARGKTSFAEYRSAKYDQAIMKKYLSDNISFAQHNLFVDQSFTEFHVIFCRNVMIYFDQNLQEHVMHLLRDSLAPFGYLGVDEPENSSRPSLDALFETAARAFKNRTVAVVLSGSNRDGATGEKLVHDYGGKVLIQDPDTAEAPEMPLATLNLVPSASVLSTDAIAARLVSMLATRSTNT